MSDTKGNKGATLTNFNKKTASAEGGNNKLKQKVTIKHKQATEACKEEI